MAKMEINAIVGINGVGEVNAMFARSRQVVGSSNAFHKFGELHTNKSRVIAGLMAATDALEDAAEVISKTDDSVHVTVYVPEIIFFRIKAAIRDERNETQDMEITLANANVKDPEELATVANAFASAYSVVEDTAAKLTFLNARTLFSWELKTPDYKPIEVELPSEGTFIKGVLQGFEGIKAEADVNGTFQITKTVKTNKDGSKTARFFVSRVIKDENGEVKNTDACIRCYNNIALFGEMGKKFPKIQIATNVTVEE